MDKFLLMLFLYGRYVMVIDIGLIFDDVIIDLCVKYLVWVYDLE